MNEENCKFCMFNDEGDAEECLINSGDVVASLEKGRYGYGTWLVVSDSSDLLYEDEAQAINYCPMCGRKL